jgi:HNH endonuclease
VTDQPLSQRLRYEVIRRDGHTCRYCGAQAPDVKLTVDHVIPRALGGQNDPTNLITACASCNAGKSSTSPDDATVAHVSASALKWARALEAAAEVRRLQWDQQDALLARFDAHWLRWHRGDDETASIPRDPDWKTSVERFVAAGLDIDDIERLIDVAGNSQAKPDAMWKYFCGCCWTEINRRQGMALGYLEGD